MTDWLKELHDAENEHMRHNAGFTALQRHIHVRSSIVERIMKEEHLSKEKAQDKLSNLVWREQTQEYEAAHAKIWQRRRSE